MSNLNFGSRVPEAFESLQGAAVPRPKRRPRGALWAWIVFLLGATYFIVPLIATLEFSLRPEPATRAYSNVLADGRFFNGLGYSFVVGLITIVLSLGLIVPTAYWVRLRLPRLRPVVEFVTLLPFVLPPIVLAYGLIRFYSREPLVLTGTQLGSTGLLIAAYVILSFPYMYRAVDNGLASMDVRVMTEAAQSRLTAISGSRDDIGRGEYAYHQSVEVIEHHRAIADEPCRFDFRKIRSCASRTIQGDLREILRRLAARGLREIVAVDLSIDHVPVKVARVIVPGLEGFAPEASAVGERGRALEAKLGRGPS